MEHLTKQQIILLTLLVSFVTSIATGIVTVSLMDQAPVGVTQTINRVVEKTIERVVSDSSSVGGSVGAPGNIPSASSTAAAVLSLDPIADAVEKVNKSVVKIKPALGKGDTITGVGVVISKSGIILTDKTAIAPLNNPVAVFPDGQEFPIQVIQSQTNGDIAFVIAIIPADKKTSVIMPISISSSIKLGQTVLSLADGLTQGIIEKIDDETSGTGNQIKTSINSDNIRVGSPLFTSSGEIVGIKTSSLITTNSFYSVNSLKGSIPVLSTDLR